MATIIPFTNAPARAPARAAPPAPVLHRQAGVAPPYVTHLDPLDLARATRDAGMEATLRERLTGKPRIVTIAPLSDRIALFFRINGEALSFWFAMFSIGLLLAAVVGAFFGWSAR